MQTGVIPNRITAACHKSPLLLSLLPSQVVLDDWRLRNFLATASGGAWASPTTSFVLHGTAQGDYITKGAVPWDLNFQDLCVNTPITLCDGVTTDTPEVSSTPITGGDLVVFNARNFRGKIGLIGIYAMRCLDDGAGHLYWSEPYTVDQRVATVAWNEQSQSFPAFPRVQVINGEFWILALDCSREVNVVTYRLVYYRSQTGEHWTRREVIVGASSDPSQSNVGCNQHDSGTPFALNDLRHSYLNIVGTNCYIVSKLGASNFVCPASSLVGVSNPALTEDLTRYLQKQHISRPTSPTLLQVTYDLLNDQHHFDTDPLLVAGARLVHKVGAVTTAGDELITYGVQYVDEIPGVSEIHEDQYKNEFSLVAGDSGARLRDLGDDQPYEFYSPNQESFDQFCDLTALGVVGGRMYVGYGGGGTALTCDVLDPNSNVAESLGYFPQLMRPNTYIQTEFRFTNSVTIYLTAAGVFQGVTSRQFYSIAYWVVLGKWVIAQAVPTSVGQFLYTYVPMYIGAAQALSPNTNYQLAVLQYHNHVMAWTSTDSIHWTKVIDYQNDATQAQPLPANLSYSGLLGHSHGIMSGSVGNNDASGGKVAMDDGAGNAKFWALKVTVPTDGIVAAVGGLFTQTNMPPLLTVGIARDNAGSMSDLTVPANVLYSTSTPPIWYSTSDAPNWRFPPVPLTTPITAGTWWIYVTFGPPALSAGQTWEWYTDAAGTHGTTMTSTDGKTWSTVAGKSMAAFLTVMQSMELVQFNNVYWSSGEMAHSLEDLVLHTASKGQVLGLTPQDTINSATLVAGWMPASLDALGDFVLDCDVSGAGAEIYFRASTSGTSTTGYKLVMGSTLSLYYLGVLKTQIDSMQFLPSSYHLRIVNQTQWLYVWVNHSLAGIFHIPNATVPGYFGVGVATFTNLRIPEMTQVIPYHIIQTGESPLTTLNKLLEATPFKWFIRFDGTMAVGSFKQAAAVDTYSDTVIGEHPTKTVRGIYNEVQPTSDHWAKRFSAVLQDLVGLRLYKKFDYTRAFSNEDAYRDGKRVLDLSLQSATPFKLITQMPVLTAEPEDRITDRLGHDYYIDSIDITLNKVTGEASQELILRKVV